MRRPGRGWQGSALALACATGVLLPAAGRAQTEVVKTPAVEPAQTRSEVKKGHQDADAGAPGTEPVATGWSAQVSDRAVAATGA